MTAPVYLINLPRDTQRLAVKQLVDDGGQTFDALSERPGQLRSLIQNSEQVFSTTANRDDQIRELFQVLPTFLDESKLTLERLDQFSADTNPLVTQLRPSARELSGTLLAVKALSPKLERFFTGVIPVIDRSEKGFSALRDVLDDELPPALGRVDEFMDDLIPAVTTIKRYKSEVTAFLGNVAAATNGESIPSGQQKTVKFLRATGPLGPGVLAGIPIGLVLTLIHLVMIPVSNTSVNPARSLSQAVFVGGWALGQVWLFIVIPLVGGAIGAAIYGGLYRDPVDRAPEAVGGDL